jgi:hypothetical protein
VQSSTFSCAKVSCFHTSTSPPDSTSVFVLTNSCHIKDWIRGHVALSRLLQSSASKSSFGDRGAEAQPIYAFGGIHVPSPSDNNSGICKIHCSELKMECKSVIHANCLLSAAIRVWSNAEVSENRRHAHFSLGAYTGVYRE